MIRSHPRVRTLIAIGVAAPLWLLACGDAPTGAAVAGVRATAAAYDELPLASPLWQAKAMQLASAFSPIASVRLHGLLGVAQYGAVVSADFGGGSAQYAARRGAVAGASAQLLASFFPSATSTLEQMVLDDGAAAPGNTRPHYERGVAAGRVVGDRMKAWAAADGFSAPWNGVPLPTGPGLWTQAPVVAPAGFQVAAMRPYFLTSRSQFRSVSPPPFGSAQFADELLFVRQSTINRTAAQAAIGNFWNTSPNGAWFVRGGVIAEAKGLDEREVAHLFAVQGGAMLDALIGCFDAKYVYQYIRPHQADALVATLFSVPNHPSYPSGHSCISGAVATVLSARFADDPAVVATVQAWMVEAGQSRIYAGLHYPFDVVAGQELGRRVAEWAIAYDHAHGLLTAVAP